MRVVGLGLSRTGTSSLAQALEILGYRTAHFMDGVEPGQWLSHMRGGDTSPPLAEMYREFDAVCDIPAACFYREFAREFPDCLFVLTTRSADSWLRSMRLHCEKIVTGDPLWLLSFGARLHEFAYGSRSFHPAMYLDSYNRHNASVVETVAAKRLLVYNLCDGAGWLPLCRFLGEPVPDVPFPHSNWVPLDHKPVVIPYSE